MLDIKLLRENPDEVEKRLQSKQSDADVKSVLALDNQVRELKHEVEQLKSSRNELSKKVGERKRAGEDAKLLLKEVGSLGAKIATLDTELKQMQNQFDHALASLVNVPDIAVCSSMDPSDNVLVRDWSDKPHFAFTPKHHLELNEHLHLFDFKRGAKIAGSGWPVYRGNGARLEWALLQYMMDHHLKRGWEPLMVPHCVRREVMYGSGQLPKFGDQLFKVDDDHFDLYLIPTSEVPLNGLHLDEILDGDTLPYRYVAYTPCFRREAGAAGGKERGLIRMHQFNKVEMFAVTRPDQADALFDEMVQSAADLLEGLGLHHRLMALVTGDLGVAAAKTIDLEVWLPGQNRYYEVSSISHCTDYQARRSQTRFKSTGAKPSLVHTLNGSGLATSRLMVALLENNQQEDGSVLVPPVLRSYVGLDRLVSATSP